MKRHATKALLCAPHLTRHVVPHNALLAASYAHVQCDVITGLSDAARLQVYHESGIQFIVIGMG